MATQEEWISLSDAAAELGMSWHRVWKRVLSGELPGKKIAGHWAVSSEGLAEYKRQSDRKQSVGA